MLYNADDTMVMGLLSYDGKNIYMYNGGIGSVSDLRNQIDEKIFVLNTDGTCVNTISLDSEKWEICIMEMINIFSSVIHRNWHMLIRKI